MRLRHSLLLGAVALVGAACVTAPPPDAPTPPIVQVDGADGRARQFGATAAEVLTNPALEAKVRALFGADWALAPGHRLRAPASSLFASSDPAQMVRTNDAEYVAVSGCGPAGCPASTKGASATTTPTARGSA